LNNVVDDGLLLGRRPEGHVLCLKVLARPGWELLERRTEGEGPFGVDFADGSQDRSLVALLQEALAFVLYQNVCLRFSLLDRLSIFHSLIKVEAALLQVVSSHFVA